LNIFNVILKTLLYQNLENINNSKKTIIDYINNKKWFELKKYIDKNPKVFELYLTDYSKQLLDAIITITTTKKDIVPERNNTSTFNEAMEANNYKEALQFNRVFCDNKNINKEENLIYILLHVVCNLNDEYEAKEKIEPKKETKNISNSLDLDVMIQIVESLLKTDLCNAFKSIRLYLDATNKREYEFLIVNLVKISVINNDNSYNESLAELNKLKDNNYKIDIAKYIGKYYLSLTVNSFEEAKLYLDIIKQASIIYKYDLNIINMEEELNQKINVFETLKNEKNITEDRGAQAEEEIEEVTESRESLIAENIATPKEEQKVSTSKLIKNKYNYVQDINLEEYIAKKYELLKKSPGIVILKKMPYERRLAIYSIIRNYPDVQAFSLYSPTEEKKSVVLKYQPRAKEQFNIREIAKEGDDAFKARDYNKCIECYKELLNINYPKSFVFAKLGLSYLKLKKKQIALDFITVAHCLSMENENGLYDFTDLIAKLRGEEVDRKPYSKVDSQEFISNEMDNYYGIDNFVEISNYIMENNLNIISAWKSLGMSEEQLDIIKLLYAREYYSAGYYDKGDEFIKLYEKSTYKTNFTITLSEKIRKEKRFFVHKEKEQTIKLSLTIKP